MNTAFAHTLSNRDTTHAPTDGNSKSGSKVAAETPSDQKWAGRWSNLPADHVKRWEKRLYVPKSGGEAVCKLGVRIQYLGRREEFRFNTTNRSTAAIEARDVWTFLKANGWDATLAKYKPEVAVKLDTTFGNFLVAVHTT